MTAMEPAERLVATGRLDLARGRFARDDGAVFVLTTRETALLSHLSRFAGQDVSRDDLLTDVCGFHDQSLSRAVDSTVTRLRRKLERDARAPEVLCTAHGHGYRLVLAEEAPPALPIAPAARPLRLTLGDRVVDVAAGVVHLDSERRVLSAQERRLLEVLAARPGTLVESARLARLAKVDGGQAALANAMWRLRAKIEPEPDAPRWIVGVRGAGYRLEAPAPAAPVEVLWTLAREAAGLAQLEDCVIYSIDGPHLVQVAAHGPKAPSPGVLHDPRVLRIGDGIVGACARLRCTQHVPDVQADPRYIADTVPGRSELAVPIVCEGRAVGVIDTESPRSGAFTPSQRAVLEALARIAATVLPAEMRAGR